MKCDLGRQTRRESRFGGGKNRMEAVAKTLEKMPALCLDTRAEECVMPCEGGLHGVGIPLPQPGAGLDIREQKGDGSFRQIVEAEGVHKSFYLFGSGGRSARRKAQSKTQGHSP